MPGHMDAIREKVRRRERLDRDDGLFLLSEARVLDLGQLAMEVRRRLHPEPVVTFVVDTNPNYTNVCNVDCTFCAFYRPPGHAEAYTHSIDEMLARIERTAALGVTTVLLQGGVNPELPLDYYTDLVRAVRQRFPDVTPHFWSAVEIEGMAAVSGLSVRDVLLRLKEAGQTTLPGGEPRSSRRGCGARSPTRKAWRRAGSTCTAKPTRSGFGRPRR